jgi:hypothetical protein
VTGGRARRGAIHALVALGAALARPALPCRQTRAHSSVPASSGWQHAATGLVLMPRLAGHQRTSLDDNGAAELDVIANFSAPDQSSVVTLYLFRPALMSVPVWFDRSETQILLRDEYRNRGGGRGARVQCRRRRRLRAAAAHVPDRRESTQGHRPAIMPLGEWLVAIRISASDPIRRRSTGKLDQVIAALRWPADVERPPEAVPVAACPSRSLTPGVPSCRSRTWPTRSSVQRSWGWSRSAPRTATRQTTPRRCHCAAKAKASGSTGSIATPPISTACPT